MYKEFSEWLELNTKLSRYSISSVVSRCKRACKISGDKTVNKKTLKKMEESDIYSSMSIYVKSQMKRAIDLYLKFMEGYK